MRRRRRPPRRISSFYIFLFFLVLVTSAGIYTYTYAAERNESCVACSQIPKDLFFHENARLSEVMEHLSTTYQMKSPGVTTTDKQGRNRTLYLPNVSSIEERTRPNLKKTLKGTTNSRRLCPPLQPSSCLASSVLLSTLRRRHLLVLYIYIFIIYYKMRRSNAIEKESRPRPKTEFGSQLSFHHHLK